MRISYAELWLSFVLAVLVAMLLTRQLARAQTTTGRILGTVHDQQERHYRATVTVTDTLRNISRTTVSDEAGIMLSPNYHQHLQNSVEQRLQWVSSREHPAGGRKDVRVDCTLKTGDSNIVVTIIEEIPLLIAHFVSRRNSQQ